MRIVKRVLLTLVFVVVALAAIAYALPSHYRVVRTVDIDAPPSKIYPLVAEVRAWKQWSAWNQRDPNMEIVYAGPPSGVGAQWNWKSKSEGNGEADRRRGRSAHRLCAVLPGLRQPGEWRDRVRRDLADGDARHLEQRRGARQQSDDALDGTGDGPDGRQRFRDRARQPQGAGDEIAPTAVRTTADFASLQDQAERPGEPVQVPVGRIGYTTCGVFEWRCG